MPQPKKSGSSARKPAARKPAARRKSASPTSAARKPASKPAPGEAAAKSREDQLVAAIAALRDLLAKGVVITADVLQETVDEAVARGRMTRHDAEDLVQNLVSIGRRQSQDLLADLESVVGRSARETRRQARARVSSVGQAARRAPGTDRALRTVDRMRRAAGLGHAFPIIGYDDLTSAQVKDRLGELNSAELRKVRDHERRNANRKTVLTAIERALDSG